MTYAYKSIYFDDPIVTGRALDIFMPDQVTRDQAVFLVHGGGWTGGSREGYHKVMEALRDQGFICGATDYRLSGVSLFEKLTDVRHGYDLFTTFLNQQGRPLTIATLGSSAGAHLSGLLSLAAPGQCGEALEYGAFTPQNEWVRPAGCVVVAAPTTFEPWEDIFPHIWTDMRSLVGVSYEDDPDPYRRLSPITYVDEDSCPVFLLHAENEHMFPLDVNMKFIDKLKALGRRTQVKTYPRVEHGFLYELDRWQQKEALADVIAFLQSLD